MEVNFTYLIWWYNLPLSFLIQSLTRSGHIGQNG
nr:MAG TPA: hypothetical protein [Caudoviricetes sp.]DAT85322.1 MAG TPA: hypothetical protein [Caudoviricetes sp.]DAW37093.1 MAG TPA: hypothetical protein [Caudoviricetes sp.]